jgi:hypothetical protein
MRKPSGKKPSEDINVLAPHIVEEATGKPVRNPGAVALGRLGGKRGQARPEKKEKYTDAEFSGH